MVVRQIRSTSKRIFARPVSALLAVFLCAAGALFARSLVVEKPAFLSPLENAVLEEVNLARTNPQTYARLLEDYRASFKGRLVKRPGKIDLSTTEGTAAVDEAIRALKKQKALPAFRISRGMSLAARDHVKDTGPRGMIGHTGTDGSSPFSRMKRYGNYSIAAAENISYGHDTGRAVVIQLIVDDGVPSRGHRTNIFNSQHLVIGISCGAHKQHSSMCVQTFAGDYQEK